MPLPRAYRFALANTLVWLPYTAVNLFLVRAWIGWNSAMALICGLIGVGMWLASGSVRALALRRDWFSLDTGALVLRLVPAVLLASAGVQLFIALCVLPAAAFGWVHFPGGHADYSVRSVVGYWINTVIALGAWTAVWVGWRALRRARDSEIARLRAEADRRALELDALRARLNPHFVFNALNNLRALINEDTERARELVTRLSNTLRHALDHHVHGRVRLGEELAVVDDYLAVEAVHYEDRLRVERHIEPAALDAKLPPMLFQLLVENAIKHGISRTPRGGRLVLAARMTDGRLQLQVDNPGTLDAASPAPGERRGGVGLAYLRAQLADPQNPGRFSLHAHDGNVRAVLDIPQ